MVKNITLSAEQILIEKARRKAIKDHSSLNAQFRTWLKNYVGSNGGTIRYEEFMARMSYVRPGRKFTRDEMNER